MKYMQEILDMFQSEKIHLYVTEVTSPMEAYYGLVLSDHQGDPSAPQGERFPNGNAIQVWGDEIMSPLTPNGHYCAMYTAKLISTMLTFSGIEVMLNNEVFQPE